MFYALTLPLIVLVINSGLWIFAKVTIATILFWIALNERFFFFYFIKKLRYFKTSEAYALDFEKRAEDKEWQNIITLED